jgi:hypothetical protein
MVTGSIILTAIMVEGKVAAIIVFFSSMAGMEGTTGIITTKKNGRLRLFSLICLSQAVKNEDVRDSGLGPAT